MGDADLRPLSRTQREELKGYIHWSTQLFRLFLFIVAMGIVSLLAKLAHAAFLTIVPSAGHDAWWLVPTFLVSVGLFVLSGRWTGGGHFRRAVRTDLAEGVVKAQRIAAVDAISVPEGEDEGPTYFIHTDDGKTLLLWGQYLETYQRRGFPWTEFEIVEAPHSRVFFGLVRIGDQLQPTLRPSPLSWEECKRYGDINAEFQFIDAPFETLKENFAALENAR